MIDYIALSIGHGLLAFAFWHLFMRAGVDIDPLVDEIKSAEKANRKTSSAAGRNAQRRSFIDDDGPRSSSVSGSAENDTRSSSVSGSAEKSI